MTEEVGRKHVGAIADKELVGRARADLEALTSHPDRHVGGPGNQAATAYFAQRAAEHGFDIAVRRFPCIEWEFGRALLEAGGEPFEVLVGPYSLPGDATSRLIVVRTVDELEAAEASGAILLICGELAAGQVMPKNFTFYNPEQHKRIVRAVESSGAAAVVSATGKDPQMVGSQYPFPLFEDGDLEVPNAYMKDVDGERLSRFAGEMVRLRLESRRVPTVGEHVVATMAGTSPGRIVVTAHIDSRKGSPGALDNAGGVAVLLGLAGLLAGGVRGPSVELVPFNGEDNYANPGEMLWVAENEGRWDEIVLGVNIDDAGMADTLNHVSFYGCPPEIEAAAREAMRSFASVEEGPQWFQSDHAIFGINKRPAIAIASSDIEGFMSAYAHTERDTIDHADPTLLADAALYIREVIGLLGAS